MMPGGAPAYGADPGFASTLAAPPSPYTSPGSGATPLPPAMAGTVQCPRCTAQTPGTFAYCQQCGLHLPAVAPTDPGGAVRPGATPQPGSLGASAAAAVGSVVDPQGATMAVPGEAARPMIASLQAQAQTRAPSSANSPTTWGTAILVNRDGSDGERFPLTNEHVDIGRVGATISFEQDRFLARSHARIERDGNGARVVCLDGLNGVFRKLELPIDLEDGTVLLVGREVLRFERVDDDERDADPLVQHGVALFGSPPRAPWARLSELLPSGAVRDIRHLNGEEIVIGREEGDLVFRDDAFMSRRHAAINWDGQRARLTDLGSSNGTFVRLSGTTALRHRDHLRMGDQLFRVELI
jgi:pSer/pThr/pTyr-binding forkhead associated (FHA) protein